MRRATCLFSKYELNCARTFSQRPCKLREIGRPLTFCKRLHLPTRWSLQQSTKDRVASNSQLNIKPKRRANPISEKYLLSRNIVMHGFTYPPPIHTGVFRCLQVRRVRSVANFCMWSTWHSLAQFSLCRTLTSKRAFSSNLVPQIPPSVRMPPKKKPAALTAKQEEEELSEMVGSLLF